MNDSRRRFFPLLFCIFLYACTESTAPQQNKSHISLNLSVMSSQIRSSRFSISNLRVFDAEGRQTILDVPTMLIEWHANESIPLHLKTVDIPEGIYSEFAMDIAINNESFRFHDKEATKNLALIDSLNNEIRLRIEPFTIKTDFVGGQLKIKPPSTHYLNITFDADRSVQPLIQDNSDLPVSIALFKPFMTAAASSTPLDSQYIASDPIIINNTLSVRHNLSEQIISMPFSRIQSSTINQVSMPWRNAVSYFSRYPRSQVRITDRGKVTVDILPEENTVTFVEGIVNVDGDKHVQLDSILISNVNASSEKRFLDNLSVKIYAPSGDLLGTHLNDLFHGQPFRGYLAADTLHLHLLDAELMAIIKSESPLWVTPLSFHDTPIISATDMRVINESSQAMKKGDLMRLSGFAYQQNFHLLSAVPVVADQVEFDLVLPSTLDANPVMDMMNDSILVLGGSSEFAHRSLKLAGTDLSHHRHIDYIELQNASVSLYSDRFSDGNRLYHYDSLEQALDILKGHLLSAHHLNEIHATGRLENNILIAEEANFVIYGFSILDTINTHDVIMSLEEEGTAVPTSTQKRTKVTLGLTLGIGLPLVTAGLIFLVYKKSMLFLQNKNKSSGNQTDARGINLKPLYSDVDYLSKTDNIKPENKNSPVDVSEDNKKTIEVSPADKSDAIKDSNRNGDKPAKLNKTKASKPQVKNLAVTVNKDNSVKIEMPPVQKSVASKVINGEAYNVVTLHETNETIAVPKKLKRPVVRPPAKNIPVIVETEEIIENDVTFKKTTLDNGHIYKTVKESMEVPVAMQPVVDPAGQESTQTMLAKTSLPPITGYYNGEPVYIHNNQYVQVTEIDGVNSFFTIGEADVKRFIASQQPSALTDNEKYKPLGLFNGRDLYSKGNEYFIRQLGSEKENVFVLISIDEAQKIIDSHLVEAPVVTRNPRLIIKETGLGPVYLIDNTFYLYDENEKLHWQVMPKGVVADIKKQLQQSLAESAKIVIQENAAGIVYRRGGKFFKEEKKNNKIIEVEVKEYTEYSSPGNRVFLEVDAVVSDGDKLNLDNWYLAKYPEDFRKKPSGELWFEGYEVTDLLQDRAMIDTELASNYVSQFSKKNNNILFIQERGENYFDLLYGAGVIIGKRIGEQDQNLRMMGYDTQKRIDELYANFTASEKKYGIFPVLGDGKHFNALVLVKVNENNRESIRSILIEPITAYNTGGIFRDTLAMLPKKYGAPIGLQAGIQVDGCSCGPISLVTATDVVNKIIDSNLGAEQINQASLENVINELKATDKYLPEDQHPRMRVEVLNMLNDSPSKKPILKDSPLQDVEFNKRVKKR